jgi:hypothetical protein
LADIVIDEWLWSDLSGDNSTEAQREAFEFIQAIYDKCDRIVTVKGSQFYQKALIFWKYTDINRRKISKYYMGRFLHNSHKSVNLEESSLKPIPVHISEATKKDDHYLIQAYLTTEASVIVTTDNPLKDAINNDINCQHRDEFIASYILQNRR